MAKVFEARELAAAIRADIAEIVAETAITALATVVRATPVGNPNLWQNPGSAPPGYVGGHARRNWNVTINAPTSEIIGRQGDGPGGGAALQDAIINGTRTIRGQGDRLVSFVIQNNVPYIGRLNRGWSEQAPANFVEKAVQTAVRLNPGARVVP